MTDKKQWRCILCTAVGGIYGRSTDTKICQWCFDDLAARGLKRCCHCNVPQPPDAFAPNSKKCRACLRAKDTAYSARTRERRNVRARARYAAKREELRARAQAYYAANKERHRAIVRAYRQRHREKINAAARRYYTKHTEQQRARNRAWYLAHPGISRVYHLNRKRRMLRAMRGQS